MQGEPVTASKKENNVSRLVSMRWQKALLARVAVRAEELGVPYQSLLQALVGWSLDAWDAGDGPTTEELLRVTMQRRGRPAKATGLEKEAPEAEGRVPAPEPDEVPSEPVSVPRERPKRVKRGSAPVSPTSASVVAVDDADLGVAAPVRASKLTEPDDELFDILESVGGEGDGP